METTRQEEAVEAVVTVTPASTPKSKYEGVPHAMPMQRREIAAQAMKELWQEMQIADEAPLIFASPIQRRVQLEHHPLLLQRVTTNGKQRKKAISGQLKSWEILDAPTYAQGLAASGEVNTLLKADMFRPADIGENGAVPS